MHYFYVVFLCKALDQGIDSRCTIATQPNEENEFLIKTFIKNKKKSKLLQEIIPTFWEKISKRQFDDFVK